jgi:hypothetical protein
MVYVIMVLTEYKEGGKVKNLGQGFCPDLEVHNIGFSEAINIIES